ncbi:hypothetical protein RD792_016620 [Penstemon davidsonii]|uniref:Uncharacterized protein n=1 Tax=Penstemon davidsonii TaxID=160366 RepID=A0ABR0CK27_9LAMI|nr:hypothetical protein RD792_016620 [Penstemon davidsonii]
MLPHITVVLLGKFFILGFLRFTGQFLGYKGVSLSSPTLGSAMSNLNPASTFILAIIFRYLGSIWMGFGSVSWVSI